MTYVRFIKFKDKVREEILAVFMKKSADRRFSHGQWLRSCYARVGQHAECYDGMQNREKATEEEYTPLKMNSNQLDIII